MYTHSGARLYYLPYKLKNQRSQTAYRAEEQQSWNLISIDCLCRLRSSTSKYYVHDMLWVFSHNFISKVPGVCFHSSMLETCPLATGVAWVGKSRHDPKDENKYILKKRSPRRRGTGPNNLLHRLMAFSLLHGGIYVALVCRGFWPWFIIYRTLWLELCDRRSSSSPIPREW